MNRHDIQSRDQRPDAEEDRDARHRPVEGRSAEDRPAEGRRGPPEARSRRLDSSTCRRSTCRRPSRTGCPAGSRSNPILPLAAILAVGSMFAAAWWLITSPTAAVAGPRDRRPDRGAGSPARRPDIVRYDDDDDLGSLLPEPRPDAPVGRGRDVARHLLRPRRDRHGRQRLDARSDPATRLTAPSDQRRLGRCSGPTRCVPAEPVRVRSRAGRLGASTQRRRAGVRCRWRRGSTSRDRGSASRAPRLCFRISVLPVEQLAVLGVLDVRLGCRVLERQPVAQRRAVAGQQDQRRRVGSLGREREVEEDERVGIERLASGAGDVPERARA